jgi:hypothetical protein
MARMPGRAGLGNGEKREDVVPDGEAITEMELNLSCFQTELVCRS